LKEINTALGTDYRAGAKVLSMLDFFSDEKIIAEMKKKQKRRLSGLKVGCYYGCLLVRPGAIGQKEPENPEVMENIIKLLGAEPVSWAYRTECCGAGQSITKPELMQKLVNDILEDAKSSGADCIAAACPLCQSNLDLRQSGTARKYHADYRLPVIYITQLAGLFLGLGYEKLGLGKDLAAAVTRSEWLELFEDLAIKYPLQKPAFIAETLVSTPLEIKRKYGLNPELLTEDNFRSLFMYLDKNKIHKDIVLDVLIDMIRGTFNIEHYFTLGTEAIHKKLKEIVDKNKEAPFAALMGLAMKELAGKASGKFISEELKKILEKNH